MKAQKDFFLEAGVKSEFKALTQVVVNYQNKIRRISPEHSDDAFVRLPVLCAQYIFGTKTALLLTQNCIRTMNIFHKDMEILYHVFDFHLKIIFYALIHQKLILDSKMVDIICFQHTLPKKVFFSEDSWKKLYTLGKN